MSRTRHVILLFLLVAARAAGAADDAPAGNMLLVTIDTLRADHLGCYGYFRDTSPNIDALAKESVFFELCLTPIATTLPAHTSLLTGVYPLEHGILANAKQGGKQFVRSELLRSFAEFAGERGYETAGFVSAVPVSRYSGIATGFETFDEPDKFQRIAEATNERVFAWLAKERKRPFFLWVHYFDPHAGYRPPGKYREMFRTDEALENYIAERKIEARVAFPDGHVKSTRKSINGYDGEIRYVDHHLGRLFDRLAKLGLWEDTAVILLSDHGEALGEHDMMAHGYVYREQLHVPLMMRIPGREPRRVKAPVSLVDVLPTAIGLLGTQATWKDFLEQASGRDVLKAGLVREPIFSQRSEREREDLVGPAFAMATSEWKLLHEPERGDRLFDWVHDLFELKNVLPERKDVADGLRSRLIERIARYEARARELGRDESDEAPEMDPEQLEKLRSLGYVD